VKALRRWVSSPTAARVARVALGLVLAPVLALCVAAALQPLPRELSGSGERGKSSVRVLDRSGRTVREVRSRDGALYERISLDALPAEVTAAVLAAEDARFHYHPGVDPLAIVRAGGQALWHGRIVSGASTVTQQLARNVVKRSRTLWGKLAEMSLALRIEASLSKRRILEEYLNRVEFGPNVRGIAAASRLYFDKPAAKLSLAEAATLAAIPRGPTLYDPRRGTALVQRRRDRVLDRMREQGWAEPAAVEAAKSTPVALQRRRSEGGARHFTRAVLSGALEPVLRDRELAEVQTTLDSDLQREVETLVRDSAERIAPFDASAAAVIVIDNAAGDVLAYVGSPDFFDARALGQNDGVLALRQPGSTLKPFVYATAMGRGSMTTATLLPDVELHLPTPEGDYSPRNYDGRYHGPVRLREALANSLNVPAVFVAQEIGPHHVLDTLHAVGFTSLTESAEHYGAAIALGDGEVSLRELGEAYSTLARGGLHRRLRAVSRARLASGREIALPPAAETRVLERETAALLTDVLSDPHARAASFGRGNVLELDFPVAAKTGTEGLPRQLDGGLHPRGHGCGVGR
jgi:penicillin-binding protein 1C